MFVSSHLISEMALTADRLVVIGRGRLLADTTVAELSAGSASLEDAFFGLTGGARRVPGSDSERHEEARHDHRPGITRTGRLRVRAGGPDGMDQAAQPALHLVDPGGHGRRRPSASGPPWA